MITHLACVMDGNRRWATKQGQFPWNGHRAGAKTVEIVINFCLQYAIPYLSLYTFSIENFNRSENERSYLFNFFIEHSESYIQKIIEQDIKINFVGNISLFPDRVQQICTSIQEKTALGKKLQINFLFGYGARQELLQQQSLLLSKFLQE